MFEELGVNIASVVIGALILLIAICWIELIDALSNQVFFSEKEDGRRYTHELKKKFLSALCVTIVSVFLIILVYVYYLNQRNDQTSLEPNEPNGLEEPREPKGPKEEGGIYESFYNFSGLGQNV